MSPTSIQRSMVSVLVSAALLVAGAPVTFAQQASASASGSASAAASASASASAKATAQVGRAAAWQDGKTIQVKKSGKAKVRGDSLVQLQARKAGLVKFQAEAKKELSLRKKARLSAQSKLKAKTSLRKKAQATAKAKADILVKARANLDIKIKAKAKAEGSLKIAKKDKANYDAKAKGSFFFSFSLKGKKLKKKVKKADAEVKQAKKDEQAARDEVKKAEKAKKSADKKVTSSKKDESKAKKEVNECKKDESSASEELKDIEDELNKTEEQIEEETPAEDPANETPAEESEPTEEVVVEPPPSTPSDNSFGYEEPVWGCFEGEVMFIEPDSQALPKDYSKYDVVSRLYACEWDIPTRAWEQGFPGIQNKFEWFAIVYSGMFNLSQGGNYKFKISSDDGTKLYIDGQLVVDNDGAHPTEVKEGSIELAAGDHELVLEYFQGPRYDIALQVWVTPPGGSEQIFSVRQ